MGTVILRCIAGQSKKAQRNIGFFRKINDAESENITERNIGIRYLPQRCGDAGILPCRKILRFPKQGGHQHFLRVETTEIAGKICVTIPCKLHGVGSGKAVLSGRQPDLKVLRGIAVIHIGVNIERHAAHGINNGGNASRCQQYAAVNGNGKVL